MSTSPWRRALGRKVRAAREGRGWSMWHIRKSPGLSASTWKRVEDGQQTSDHALLDVAEALGWPASEPFRVMADELDKPGSESDTVRK